MTDSRLGSRVIEKSFPVRAALSGERHCRHRATGMKELFFTSLAGLVGKAEAN